MESIGLLNKTKTARLWQGHYTRPPGKFQGGLENGIRKHEKQNFGIEIELTCITRGKAASVIAKYFGTRSRHAGGAYDPYTATDRKGRVRRAMTDGSIDTRKRVNGVLVSANRDYSCEVVSPILQYEDIEDLQESSGCCVKRGPLPMNPVGFTSMWMAKTIPPKALPALWASPPAGRTCSMRL